MSEALEEYIMKSSKSGDEKPAIAPLDVSAVKPLLASNKTIPSLYESLCKVHKQSADSTVMRLFEAGNIEELDLSQLAMRPADFLRVMEVCMFIPKLAKINLENTNPKPENIQHLVEMAIEHPTLEHISLANNPTLGFSAARVLLPLIKANRRITTLNIEGTCMAAPTKELIDNVLVTNGKYMAEERARKAAEPDNMTGTASAYGSSFFSAGPGGQSSVGASEGMGSSGFNDTMGSVQQDPFVEIRQRNEEMLAEIQPHEDGLRGFYPELMGYLGSQFKEIKNNHNRGGKTLDVLKEEHKYATNPSYTIQKAMEELHLSIQNDYLERVLAAYTLIPNKTTLPIKHLLGDLLDRNTGRRRKQHLLDELEGKIKGHGPEVDTTVIDVVTKFMELLGRDANSLDKLKEMLVETDDQILALAKKAETEETLARKAAVEEDIRTAEEQWEECMDTHEQHIDLLIQRLKSILDGASRAHLLQKLNDLQDVADTVKKRLGDANSDLQDHINEDIEKLKEKVDEEKQTQKEQEEMHGLRQRDLRQEMEDNSKEQGRMWDEIDAQFKTLTDLADTRRRCVDDWITCVTEAERDRKESAHLIEVCEDHIKTLNQLQNDTEVYAQILKELDDYVKNASDVTNKLADSTSEEADNLADRERESYLVEFRKYYMLMGELMYRKQKRLEETDRMIRSCEFQINFCKETLDPDIKRYRVQLKDLTNRRVEVVDALARWQVRADDRATQFLPVEEYMKAHGREFDSPLVEMQESVIDYRGKALGLREKFVAKDKEVLIDHEKQEIDNMATNAKQARNAATGGLSSLILPLSTARGQSQKAAPLHTPQRPASGPRDLAASPAARHPPSLGSGQAPKLPTLNPSPRKQHQVQGLEMAAPDPHEAAAGAYGSYDGGDLTGGFDLDMLTPRKDW